MRKLITLIAFTFFALNINAQNNIVKGTGICYTNGVPTVTINTDYYCEIAIDTTTGKIYVYARDTAGGSWIHYGWPLRETGTVGAPAYTPTDKQSYFAVNLGDSLYFYGGGSWGLVSGGTGADTQDLSITAGGGTIRIVDGGYVVLNDSTITNEGLLDWSVTTNLLTLTSNTSGSETFLSAGRGISNLTDSSGYLLITSTEVDGSITNEIQTLTATGDEGTLRLSSGGFVILNDSSSVNEGLIAWGVTANLADVISNTLGSETLYMAGRNGLVISDSSGYMLFTQTTGGTDNQVIDTFVLTTKNLRLSLEDDAEATKVVYFGMMLDTATSFAGDVSGIYSNLQLGSGVVTTTEIAANTIQTGDVDDDHIIVHDGNTRGTTLKIGTNDNHQLDFETNGTVRLSLNTSGVLSVGSTTPSLLSNASLTSAASFTVGNSANTLTLSSSSSSAAAILLSTTDATTGGVTIGGNSYTSTSIAKKILKFTDNYTSSTTGGTMSYAEITGTINCTGTNNSAIYGFSSVPTLTSIASSK